MQAAIKSNTRNNAFFLAIAKRFSYFQGVNPRKRSLKTWAPSKTQKSRFP
jgi:hypothetical protein